MGKELALGKGSRLKQKGMVHIELDFFEVLKTVVRAHVSYPDIEPLAPAANPTPAANATERRESAEPVIETHNTVPALSVQEPTPTKSLVVDSSQVIGANPMGVLQIKVESGSFNFAGYLYVEILKGTTLLGCTRTPPEKTMSPEWVFGEDKFVTDMNTGTFTIQCKGSSISCRHEGGFPCR
jgi:hypothetical protein